ncbi:Orn/DAP/Arg decarboxylase 2 [Roseivivax marinus]|uniref:ornithine decarboxylase n=1 Tax=Roseivivax marinus TaxID=1379903 RepID=W4HG89_9RHOB|nr:ornithine decarboxylase [Roseivivax marinus]ETW11166.1 Orn/DAP/Arg decarboxylase 2 [Roseivivax marinus]
MSHTRPAPADPVADLVRRAPDRPVLYFEPAALHAAAARFRAGFPGEVTYAVKANPAPEVVETLAAAGLAAFDVASPAEMTLVRGIAPGAVLHYHNPIRSTAEIAEGLRHGARSWSVDRPGELRKLDGLPTGTEIAVRLKLPVPGAAYDFGSKFGAVPAEAAELLRAVAARGFTPSLTFHPGTQCPDGAAWARYIHAAADVARAAGVTLHRLNVGGGFPSRRDAAAPDLEAIFRAIAEATAAAFDRRPALVCEPGRALVADAVTLALRVKAAEDDTVFLNDGVYGALGEWRDLPAPGRIGVHGPDGKPRSGTARERIVFGPTCDSVDRLPTTLPLPEDLCEGDWLVVPGMGAYAGALVTGFNGYGARDVVTLSTPAG